MNLTWLKQGPGATFPHVQQIAGRTGQQSSLLVGAKGLPVIEGTDVISYQGNQLFLSSALMVEMF